MTRGWRCPFRYVVVFGPTATIREIVSDHNLTGLELREFIGIGLDVPMLHELLL